MFFLVFGIQFTNILKTKTGGSKIIIFIALAIMAATIPACADDDNDYIGSATVYDGVKYKVTIEITYDAVSQKDKEKIISDIASRYKKASGINLKATKIDDGLLLFEGSHNLMLPDYFGATPN